MACLLLVMGMQFMYGQLCRAHAGLRRTARLGVEHAREDPFDQDNEAQHAASEPIAVTLHAGCMACRA
jgi:hypothetical protein